MQMEAVPMRFISLITPLLSLTTKWTGAAAGNGGMEMRNIGDLFGLRKRLIVVLLVSILAGCTSMCPPGQPVYLRVEDYYHGWKFIGVFFTPDVDVVVSILNAPVPCGGSFCGSGAWEPIGTFKSGPIGGTWPNIAGQFGVVINRDDMAARRGVNVTCYPGEGWDLTFSAKDPVTGRATVHHGSTTAGFFYDLPPCR